MEDFLKPFLEKGAADSLGKTDTGIDTDIKLLEANLENIFCSILSGKLPVDENFPLSYETFLGNCLEIFAKSQRTVKFITKFLTSIKTTKTLLVKEIILPSNFLDEFSKAVAAASNQQSLGLLDVLVSEVDNCFSQISQNDAEGKPLLLFITSELLIAFFKEVKLYTPSIAFITLRTFIEKLVTFKGTLQRFGNFLFSSKSFMFKNENIVRTFLELCLYCGEIQTLIDCYKDSILQPSEVNDSSKDDSQSCLSLEQWDKLVNFVMKSKIESCSTVCFHLALQNIRILKLQKNVSLVDESTVKVINHQLSLDLSKFNIFQQMPPEDFTIVMDILTVNQFKAIIKNVFNQSLETGDKDLSLLWLSNPTFQENTAFIVSLLTEILRKAGSHLGDMVDDKSYSRISWLDGEYFDERNCVSPDSLKELPEKINVLLRNGRKIRKSVGECLKSRESLSRIVEIFKLLPLPYMTGEFRRLGLSFAVGIGVLLASDENSACLAFESICSFIASDTDASTCFDVGLCITWLTELHYESNRASELKQKVIETLVRNSPNMTFGLNQIGDMIDSMHAFRQKDPLKMLETRVVLYNELGKCWQRGKKRTADNDLIGSHRNKLAKMISEESKELKDSAIDSENCKILLKILAIELNKSVRMNEGTEIKNLMEGRFPAYFEFAVKNLKKGFEEASVLFLTVVLQSLPQLRTFLQEDSLLKIWKALRTQERPIWRLFCSHSTDEEFGQVLEDLLKMSKKFLNSDSQKYSTNCFEIWVSFFESSTEGKRQSCQLRLQEFFNHVHDCGLLLRDLPIRKKIFLIRFFSFYLTKSEFIVTSHVLDTIIHVTLECLEGVSSTEDFHNLFIVDVDVASAVLLRQFAWSRSKVHLTFVMFKRFLGSLMTRCDAGQQINKDDLILLSNCAFCLEKWVSAITKKEKDFARTAAYFITALISSIASVTVLPAIKIHLTNCINHFLSISDSHTVAYLMRILKPGYQQVFNTLYNQFKKYHKYSGKI